MMKLYQREHCSGAKVVRDWLAQHGLSYHVVNVPKLGSERHDVIALTGGTQTPVLQDGERVLVGSETILPYLEKQYALGGFGDPSYGLTRNLGTVDFAEARTRTEVALKEVGFGVLTEIDVKATLKKKIDVDFRPYLILGACNPKLAYTALSAELPVGLLLPCNVVLTQENNGDVIVSAVDPIKMFEVVNRPDVEPLAREVKNLLEQAMQLI